MSVRVLGGHVVDVLAQEPAGHFHLAVTSPPYLWLRSYQTEPQVWPAVDGTPLCEGEHEWGEVTRHNRTTGVASASAKQNSNTGAMQVERAGITGAFCTRCGAWRGELGSEPTVELYIAHLVQVFEAVRRVLRDDATLWVNLGASYMSNPGGQNGTSGGVSDRAQTANRQAGRQDRTSRLPRDGWLKPLDYVDVPGLFGHAMQAAGWTWRADIALVKKAPLPESVSGWAWTKCRVKVRTLRTETATSSSVGHRDHLGSGLDGTPSTEWADCPGCPKCRDTDGLVLRRGNGRPTRSWERLLVFAKRTPYYFDSEGVREPAVYGYRHHVNGQAGLYGYARAASPGDARANPRGWAGPADPSTGRNLRDWQFWPTTGGVGGLQHYAAYPLGIPTLAVKAGTSERCCPACGAPHARIVEREQRYDHITTDPGKSKDGPYASQTGNGAGSHDIRHGVFSDATTLGWRPTCTCNRQDWQPARVLDPFGGSGSTAIAAERLGRDCVLVDLQPDYTKLALRRVTQDAPLLLWGQVEHVEMGAVPSEEAAGE